MKLLSRMLFARDFRWHTLPAGAELFGRAGPCLAGAEVVKDGTQRTIYRVALPTGTVFVKRCRANTPRAWLREWLRPTKAKLEFENACRLQALGLPVVEPLAWASQYRAWPGESLFVTRCADAEHLERFLETHAIAPALRCTVARELGTLFARMHDAGLAHPDPHPGNLLVRFADGRPEFLLIDVHAVRFAKPLGWPSSRANLVLLNRWFQMRATRADRLRFWRAYTRARELAPLRGAQDVEARTLRSNARFWQHRTARYRAENRQYRRVRLGSIRGHAVRELPQAVLDALLADPDAPFRDPANRTLKDGRSSSVVEMTIPSPGGPRRAIYKRFRVKSLLAHWKNALRPTAAMRSWLFGLNLLDRGLPTARPLCVLQRFRAGVPAEGYLLTEKVPEALELPAAVLRAERRPELLRPWAERLGRLLRHMHAREVSHRDLKALNILMSGTNDLASAVPVLIDLVGVETGVPVSTRVRVRNLARLNASFLASTSVARTDRLRVLRAYMAWGLHGSAGWKDLWRAVERATRAKAAKNAKTGRVLA